MRQSFSHNFESSIAKIKRREGEDGSGPSTPSPNKKLKTQGNPISVPTNNNTSGMFRRSLLPPSRSQSRIAKMQTSKESKSSDRSIPVIATASGIKQKKTLAIKKAETNISELNNEKTISSKQDVELKYEVIASQKKLEQTVVPKVESSIPQVETNLNTQKTKYNSQKTKDSVSEPKSITSKIKENVPKPKDNTSVIKHNFSDVKIDTPEVEQKSGSVIQIDSDEEEVSPEKMELKKKVIVQIMSLKDEPESTKDKPVIPPSSESASKTKTHASLVNTKPAVSSPKLIQGSKLQDNKKLYLPPKRQATSSIDREDHFERPLAKRRNRTISSTLSSKPFIQHSPSSSSSGMSSSGDVKKLHPTGTFRGISMSQKLDSLISKSPFNFLTSLMHKKKISNAGDPHLSQLQKKTESLYEEFMLKSRTSKNDSSSSNEEKTMQEKSDELARKYRLEILLNSLKSKESIEIRDDEGKTEANKEVKQPPIVLPADPIDDYEIQPVGDDHHFLRYPYKTKKSVMVYDRDFERLNKDIFLNDTLIDVFPKIWSDEYPNASIYTYSSFFYTKLAGPEINYETVKRWTAQENIFKKQFVIIPIAQNNHWFVILVVNPGYCLKGEKGKEYHPNIIISDDDSKLDPNKPYIMVLDPLNLNKTAVSKDIINYLQHEALHKLHISESEFQDPEIITSQCPRQKNFTDCGVYCLHYINSLYKYPDAIMSVLHNNVRNDEAWDRDHTLPAFRSYLQRMLKKQIKNYREHCSQT